MQPQHWRARHWAQPAAQVWQRVTALSAQQGANSCPDPAPNPAAGQRCSAAEPRNPPGTGTAGSSIGPNLTRCYCVKTAWPDKPGGESRELLTRPAVFRLIRRKQRKGRLFDGFRESPLAFRHGLGKKGFKIALFCLRILVAITGASGVLYAQRLLDNLAAGRHELHVVLSNYAHAVIAEELPGGLRLPPGVATHTLKSMNAPFASGSNPPDAMVVIPCSMGTLGRIAHGYSEDVLLRAADVALKEKRKLILVPREAPLNLVHIRNMELLLLAGAVILPANPSFYTRPKTIEEVVDTVVGRVLDHLGVEHNLTGRWGVEGDCP